MTRISPKLAGPAHHDRRRRSRLERRSDAEPLHPKQPLHPLHPVPSERSKRKEPLPLSKRKEPPLLRELVIEVTRRSHDAMNRDPLLTGGGVPLLGSVQGSV